MLEILLDIVGYVMNEIMNEPYDIYDDTEVSSVVRPIGAWHEASQAALCIRPPCNTSMRESDAAQESQRERARPAGLLHLVVWTLG